MIRPEHRALLNGSAITDEVIDSQGIDSNDRGIIFPWRSPDGVEVLQLRPDQPDADLTTGRLRKYLWPRDQPLIMNRLRDSGTGPVLIVEGTKQQYAALSYAAEEYAVYGISGCWGWVSPDDGKASWVPDVLFLMGRDVYVCFDADMETNWQVHRAAQELTTQLKRSGVASVRYVQTTARGTNGLDDVLASLPEERRAQLLALWISQAPARLPKAPKKPQANPFIAENGSLLVRRATEAVMDKAPAALTAEREVALYRNGAFRLDPSAFIAEVVALLGDLYRREWRANIAETATGLLYAAGRILPERQTSPLLNVANGMLDLPTMTLKPHDPVYMSSAQIPINWDPDAKAPTYERWLQDVIPDQIEDLEEVASTMLDPSRTPSKAIFAFGPSRSGKSTFIRILQAIAGLENRSAVTLHQLCGDRFAAANVYGKILNASSDLSASEVTDLSVFKMMTGEDSITGNRKYGAQFTFTNRALFAFSANELPTVGETSRAYLERIKPFEFGRSFAGRENPAIESAIMGELEGILVRLVIAWNRMSERGAYSPTLPKVRTAFEIGSNRVRQWIEDEMWIYEAGGRTKVAPDEGRTLKELHRLFGRWAEENKTSSMGLKTFTGHLTSVNGVREVRIMPNSSRGYNVAPKRRGEDQGAEGADLTPTVETPRKEGNELVTDTSQSAEEVRSPQSHNSGSESAPSAPMVLDLETAAADTIHSFGPEFVRLSGYTDSDGSPHILDDGAGPTAITVSTALANGQAPIIGHNVIAFDLVALARYGHLRLDRLRGKVVDTEVRERLLDPPLSGKEGTSRMPKGYYGLADSTTRRGLPTKTDELARLAKIHGGYHMIPKDDPEYRSYLLGDLEATKALADAQGPLDAYALREMDQALIKAQMTVNGFRVDVPLLAQRLREQEIRKGENTEELAALTGMPLGRTRTFKTKPDRFEPFSSPTATKEGKAAILAFFERSGLNLDRLKKTGKSGDVSFAADDLRELREKCSRPSTRVTPENQEKLVRALDLILAVNGERTVYQTMENTRVGDRVHPQIKSTQASGRDSVTNPGLTVLGKRGGKHVERAPLLPEIGHRIIAVDLDQVDARAVAGHSQDPGYMAIFQRGEDLHATVAQAVFGDPKMREQAKAISHGWNYGEGPGRMVKNGVPAELAYQFDREMRVNFPGLVGWQEDVRAQASAGQLLDNGWGRKMRPDPRFAYTQAPALVGQGCTRDILAEGLLRLPVEFWPYLRVVVHDEVVLSVPEKDAEEIGREVVKAFTMEFRGVPITAGCSKPGRTWAEVYEK